MSETSETPDPMDEPESGVAPGGTAPDTGESGRAANAEVVLDQSSEGGEPEQDAADQVDRIEQHNRGRGPGDTPSG